MDPKRQLVVDKFKHSLELGLEEREDAIGIQSLSEYCEQLEEELFTTHSFRDYKAKVFTLNFNLGDKRNPGIRKRILDGKFPPSELAKASSEDLACEDLQTQRQERRDKYYTTMVVKETEESNETIVSEDVPIEETSKRVKTDPIVALKEAVETVLLPTIDMPPTPQKPIVYEQHEIHEKCQDVDMAEETSRGVNEFAEKLKLKLAQLNHPPLRQSHTMYIDYLVKHCTKSSPQ